MEWVPLLGTLSVGVVIGNIIAQTMTNARERRAQKVAHRKQQLEQFYGPLLALHKEILARSELRVKLQQALQNSPPFGDLEAHVRALDANVEDENQTFREVLMPRYREMVSTFRDKMWLAEPETREFFVRLVEFVNVWEKVLDKKLPGWVADRIGHTEANLKPFYAHLEEVHDRFRREIG